MSKRSTRTLFGSLLLIGALSLTGCDAILNTSPGDSGAAPGKQVEQIGVAEDTNTKTDLDSIARAQELNFAVTETYFTDIAAVQSEGNVKFALSGSATTIAITADSSNFIITALSQTGKVFVRASGSSETIEFANVDAYNAAPSPIEGLEKPLLG